MRVGELSHGLEHALDIYQNRARMRRKKGRETQEIDKIYKVIQYRPARFFLLEIFSVFERQFYRRLMIEDLADLRKRQRVV